MSGALKNARRSVWVHRGMAGVWVLLAIPTLLWWKDSILWVLMISLYANFVSHLGAAQAAQAEVQSIANPPPDA